MLTEVCDAVTSIPACEPNGPPLSSFAACGDPDVRRELGIRETVDREENSHVAGAFVTVLNSPVDDSIAPFPLAVVPALPFGDKRKSLLAIAAPESTKH